VRIAFLIHRLEGGGAERQLCLLALHLQLRGHEVEVISFYPGGAYRRILDDGGVKCRDLGKKTRNDLVTPLARLVGILRTVKPEILHGYLPTGNLLVSLCAPLLPNARIVWGIRGSRMDYNSYAWFHKALYLAENSFRWSPHLVIANSQAGVDDLLRRGFKEERLAVVPNGIDTQVFQRDPEGRNRLRRAMGLEPEDRLI
jgi:glycosyltransferase involved in cell wall biosynthesis